MVSVTLAVFPSFFLLLLLCSLDKLRPTPPPLAHDDHIHYDIGILRTAAFEVYLMRCRSKIFLHFLMPNTSLNPLQKNNPRKQVPTFPLTRFDSHATIRYTGPVRLFDRPNLAPLFAPELLRPDQHFGRGRARRRVFALDLAAPTRQFDPGRGLGERRRRQRTWVRPPLSLTI